MSMTIILNQRIYFPAHDNNGLVINVGSVNHNVKCPKVDTHNVCSISVRLGEFYGYDLASYLDMHTGGDANGYEWVFGVDDATNLIESIEEKLGESAEDTPDLNEDLEKIKQLIKKALDNGADEFEIYLW